MKFTPFLAIPGVLLGSLVISLLGYFLMAGVTLPPPALAALPEATPVVEEAAAAPDADQPTEVQEVGLEEPLWVAAESDHVEAAPEAEAQCVVSENFPKKIRKWCAIISHYADKRGLPADLVAAVIFQESGGNEVAYSKSGAVGLMQVMPRDGLASGFMCVNGPCFGNRPSTEELQDPDFNVSYGTKMLARLVDKHGNFRDALKAYGPMDSGYYYADKVLGIYERYRSQ